MGYPTKRVKVRRHNRNIRLHATVVLCGAEIIPARALSAQGFVTLFYARFNHRSVSDSTTPWTLNPVKAMEDAAAVLGLDV